MLIKQHLYYLTGVTSSSCNSGKRNYRACAVLTPEGCAYAAKVVGMADHAVAIGSRGLTDADREVLCRVLVSVSDNLEQFCRTLEKGSI